MYRMLTCFNLKPEATIEEFRRAVDEFARHLATLDLVESTGPIGRRQRHPIMDTDSERDHEYFFIMSFRDLDHCDRAVEYIQSHDESGEAEHVAMYSKIEDPIFICWEDLE